MSRVYFIHDPLGERRLGEQDLPLPVGGAARGGIVLPGVPATALVAHIGLADGHAFVQTARPEAPLFHNHERLTGSKWLKSGDQVQHGESVLQWTVQGDQVFIRVHTGPADGILMPPPVPPPVAHRALPEITPIPGAKPGHRVLRWLAPAAFVLLLTAVAFVLLATPIEVRVAPEPDRFSIDGFPPVVAIAGRRLALPGTYLVRAERAGFRPLRRPIEVGRDYRVFQLQLEELPGRIGFDLKPDVPFRLFLDDRLVETDAGGLAEIAGGTYRMRIETELYLPVEERLQVAGEGRTQRISRVLQPAWARVRIDSEPAGARVEVDGKTLGVTPLETELLQGRRKLTLVLEKYRDFSVLRQVQAGIDLVLEPFRLQPVDGRLEIGSEPAGANLSVDGEFRGTTPTALSLTPGVEHRLRLMKPGYGDIDLQVTLEADEDRTLVARLQPRYGTLFVTAQPADASLRVDGRDMGGATRRLRLTARRHRLEFSKPGYVAKSLTVTPRAGSSSSLDVVLEKAAPGGVQPAAAGPPAIILAPGGQRLQLVRPGGSFSMGASRREAGQRANESRRLVRLERLFYLAGTEVSNREFRQFRPAHDSGYAEGSSLDDDSQPAVNVSWNDAARYCNWLSDRAGLPAAYVEVKGRMQAVLPMTTGFRLPSEAEWSYAARRHSRESERRYPWDGGYPPAAVAGNFADASVADTLANTIPDYNDGYRVAAPVASFAARPDGFYDLGGNVAEWVHDYYAVYPGEAGIPVTDPLGPASGEHHSVRDSSWRQGSITELRLSYRDYSRTARPDLGFRIARYAE